MAYQPPAPQPLPYRQAATTKTTRSGGNGCLWIGMNFLVVVFLAIGGFYGWRSYSLFSTGGHADGTVVEMDESHDDDGTSYAPIVDFVVDGQHYQMTGSNSSNPPAYHVGQTVSILYDRANPSLARIDNFWELWLLPLIFLPLALLFGVIFNAAMLVGLVQRIRNRSA